MIGPPAASRFCPSCGISLEDPTSAVTETSASNGAAADAGRTGFRSSSASAPSEGRFLPGAMLAGRYRIVGLIGKGGMGQVYRADDLKLGQPVALKFLPEGLERDQRRLDRFLNEVRVALRVSHPNVCRVHDIGEVDGQHFLSMEYVDGEDLASLLRRIGRLPRDKAVQIARQLCAGLAAAHEQGILHRDLKPANVMLDGQGRAKITDFGLAGLASSIEGAEVRSGTPAYMAPEQLAGREVTVRSDIYALGLLLYELYTGKPAFSGRTPAELARLHQESAPSSPSSLVDGFDPAVESVILRCLEKDPRKRPDSVMSVAAALPGGDPLAAALAAGETPSPEMVAAAGDEGGLRPVVAVACLGSFVASVALQLVLAGRLPETRGLLSYAPVSQPPVVLAREAIEISETLGYDEPPADSAFGFGVDSSYLRWIEENDASRDRWEQLASGGPPAIYFWYRQSPRLLVPERGNSVVVSATNPRLVYSGEIQIGMDPEGRLRTLWAVPPQLDESTEPPPEVDWSPLFTAAGLDEADFRRESPQWNPPDFADSRAAWSGSYPERPDIPLRIEAAAYRGRPVWFDTLAPWDRPWRMVERELSPGLKFIGIFFSTILVLLMAGAVLLARRNLRMGRGDRRGAFKVALFIVLVLAAEWVLNASHVPDLQDELGLFFNGFPVVLFLAGLAWLVYVALEPFLRRRWPDALISWNRLLAGRLRDPLIGRDILVGAAAFGAVGLLGLVGAVVSRAMAIPPPNPQGATLALLLGGRRLLAQILVDLFLPLLVTMGILFLLLLLRVILRKHWFAVVALILILTLPSLVISPPGMLLLNALLTLLVWIVVYILLARFGLLSVCAFFFFAQTFAQVPTSDFSAWYASGTIAMLLAMAVVAGFGFYTSMAGRHVFGESMVPQE
jgi:serine/threonine-protein kinase